MGFVYESMWIGVIQAMRVQATGWKQTDLQLSYSRDGRHWLRPRQRASFIPLGDAGSWDADYFVSCYTQPVLVGDAVPLTKDTTRGRMVWKSKDDLDHPGDDHVRIRYELKNAKLYSFWIE